MLIGGSGSDSISDSEGRNLLVGGEGVDEIDGSENDLIIDDAAPQENQLASLDAALADWVDTRLISALANLGF
ncbi:MAG: hypothetical protein KDB00_12130 [Planctomycetales bacterium]|nr:hypothetical protein [Planctomycetales bacterium]